MVKMVVQKCLPTSEKKRTLILAFLVYKVCQIQFTSTYNNNNVTGIVGSSVNFTWNFSGDVKEARLVTQDGSTELLVISITSFCKFPQAQVLSTVDVSVQYGMEKALVRSLSL